MFLIFDCNYICWNVAHAFSKGLSYKGGRTEVIFGFVKQLLSLSERFEADQIAFCWDSKQNKRKEIYPEYKTNRHKDLSEEEQEGISIIFPQFEEIKLMLPELGFSNVFELNGYESDDIIARLVLDKYDKETVVISSDEDLFQLLDHCSIYSISKKQTMTKDVFQRHYRIEPKEWVDVKAIAGCKSDYVKGVKGVGEKKAIDYIKGSLNKGMAFLSIQNSKEVIDRNYRLVRLPFEGTPAPRIRSNHLSLSEFKIHCKGYGFDSICNEETWSRWGRIMSRMNRG